MAKTKHKTAAAGSGYFSLTEPLRYEGENFQPSPKRPLGYRWYDPQRKVLGKRMEDHLRFAVCYWHSFVWRRAPTRSATRPSCAPGTPPAAMRCSRRS